MTNSEHKKFQSPDEVRTFEKGKAEILNIGGGVVGRLILEPGWRWSKHVKPLAKTEWCEAPHLRTCDAFSEGISTRYEKEVKKMYKKVLVPLDGSALAECTLSHVKNLFKDGSVGEVTLLNVVKVDLPWAQMGSDDIPTKGIDLQAIIEPLFIASRRYLADIESRLGSEGIKVKTESLEGNRPADTITEYAQEKGMDMIIIGTHGYTGLKKLMMGSVAFGVLHQSHIPVLLIRPESCWP